MKNYKKYQLLFILCFIYIIFFIMFLIYLNTNYYIEYIKLDGIYILDNVVEVIVSDQVYKKIERNNYIYLNSQKRKIKIISITKKIYKKDNIYYNQILFKINGKISNDLNISIYNKKEKLIQLFIDEWKEK